MLIFGLSFTLCLRKDSSSKLQDHVDFKHCYVYIFSKIIIFKSSIAKNFSQFFCTIFIVSPFNQFHCLLTGLELRNFTADAAGNCHKP